MSNTFNEFINYVEKRNPNEPEFLQAVQEVTEDLFLKVIQNYLN